VAEKLAEVYHLPVETVAEVTTENAMRLFKVNSSSLRAASGEAIQI
jgi:hypothetical protein